MSPAALRRPLDPAYIGSPFALRVPFLQETDGGRVPLDLAGRNVAIFLDRQGLPDQHVEITATDAGDGVALFEASAAETKDWPKGDYYVEVRLDGVSVVVGRIAVAQGAAARGSDMVGAAQPPSTQGVLIAGTGVVQVVLPPQGLKGDKGDAPTADEIDAMIAARMPHLADVALSDNIIPASAAPGDVVGSVEGVLQASYLRVEPNDGRFGIAGDPQSGFKLVRGDSPIAPGPVSVEVVQDNPFAGNGPTLATPVTLIVAAAPPQPGDMTFAHSPWRLPSESNLLTPTAAQANEARDLWVGAIPAGYRPVFVHAQKATDGGSLQIPSSPLTLDFVSLFTGSRGVGYVNPSFTFGGAQGVTLQPGATPDSIGIPDALAADYAGGGYLRVSTTTPAGGQRPRGWTTRNFSTVNFAASFPPPYDGEYGRNFTAAQAALRQAGNINSAAGGVNTGSGQGFTPAAMIGPTGADIAVVVIGDSLDRGGVSYGDDPRWNTDSRGNYGATERGLDNPLNGRIRSLNLSSGGASAAVLMSGANLALEKALLTKVRDQFNGGQRWPVHAILSGVLRNDFTTMGEAATLDGMWARATTWWSFLADWLPGLPIIQRTISIRANSANGFFDHDGQSPVSNVDTLIDGFNQRMIDEGHPALAGVLDLRSAHYVMIDGVARVPLTPFSAAGGGVLVSAIAANQNVSGGVTIDCPNGPPAVGDYLVVDPGQPNMDRLTLAIGLVTQVGATTQYVVRTPLTNFFAFAHAPGALVCTAPMQDTTHFGSPMATRIGDLIAAQKGVIRAAVAKYAGV